MEPVIFDYSSKRSKKARLAHSIDGPLRYGLIALIVFCVLTGSILLVGSQPFGWLIVGISALPAILLGWYEGELKPLPPSSAPKRIDDVLAADILGQLPKEPTPRDIADAIGAARDGWFFAARFGITAGFLQNIASDDKADTPFLWKEAFGVQQEVGQQQMSGGVLLVALMRLFPGHDALLAQQQIDVGDLLRGITWQQHILDLIRHHLRPKRTGGIARDWSFGYIPLLSRFGRNISDQIVRGGMVAVDLESHTEALDQLVKTFSAEGRQNIALVGPLGSGKTSIVQSFAAHLLDAGSSLPDTLKFRQVFMLDATSLLAAAPGRGELENLIMSVLGEAYAAKNIIICLDNAELFFEDGIGSVDLSNTLLPILEAGRLRIILTMDEQRFLKISSRNSALANTLNRVTIGPATEPETLAVMQDHLITTEFTHKVTYTYQALREAYRLSERYVYDLAQPGRALKLMESAASHSENGLVTANSVHQAIEKTIGVKVGVASSDAEREALLNLENKIHERMVNQTRAVQVVSDALRRARTGVRSENRPIGTFLFLGPTGVGKTELAKALAGVYFNGEDHMIRVDLNEYVRLEDVSRLIADGADDPTGLTARVMKQPFSVVLLDEIEKAHPAVLATLLQLLDEGVLRDVKNREVSFRDTIIIATSNAGANRIREYIERGYKLEQFEKQLVDELINSNQFRPEFLNRFDEIVVFRPLEMSELLQVVDMMIAGINVSLEPQKMSVVVEQAAKAYLVEQGFDPRLGARPLRRVVQRAVENTVAKQMLAGSALPGSTITITLEQVSQILGSANAANAIASSPSTM